MNFSFELLKTSSQSKARLGVVNTRRGPIKTPVFMPVGTLGNVKSLDLSDLNKVQAQIILANTYHLLIRPGIEVFKKFQSLHQFMNWSKPILTDSGGYQIFCLAKHRKITEEGAIFRSYLNGDLILLSPEKSIEVQTAIGSDIMMVLDWCIHSTANFAETQEAMNKTHSWALRSLKARTNQSQALFAIVQGGVFQELRQQSAQTLTQYDFDGFAIGGLAVGETKLERETMTDFTTDFLPPNKPRYLMGVGTPLDLLEAVYRGVDMFDCVIPTMYGQRGQAFTSTGRKNLLSSQFKFLDQKLDETCTCYTCATHSVGYLHHLSKAKEATGWRLLALHNLTHYHWLMQSIRDSIANDTFEDFYNSTKKKFGALNLD